MTRKRNATARPALIRAFAAGALTGAAGTLTLRRRRPRVVVGNVAGPLGESALSPMDARFDARSQGSDSMPVAKPG